MQAAPKWNIYEKKFLFECFVKKKWSRVRCSKILGRTMCGIEAEARKLGYFRLRKLENPQFPLDESAVNRRIAQIIEDAKATQDMDKLSRIFKFLQSTEKGGRKLSEKEETACCLNCPFDDCIDCFSDKNNTVLENS